MRKFPFSKMTFNMLLAVLAAVVLVAINEAGYISSNAAIQRLEQAQSTRRALDRLVREMLSLESGLRGYLLTGNSQYIESYAENAKAIDGSISRLHGLLREFPEDSSDFAELSNQISRRLSELDHRLVCLRRSSQDDFGPRSAGTGCRVHPARLDQGAAA